MHSIIIIYNPRSEVVITAGSIVAIPVCPHCGQTHRELLSYVRDARKVIGSELKSSRVYQYRCVGCDHEYTVRLRMPARPAYAREYIQEWEREYSRMYDA